VAADVDRLERAVGASPVASVALVQLLRVSEPIDLREAVVAESFVYSLLQTGEHHRRWLADRPPAAARPPTERPVVGIDRAADTLTVVLDRPDVRNAYSARMRDELVAALEVAVADPAVRVELRGAGPDFCSGGDLDEFGTTPSPTAAHLIRTTRNAGLVLAHLAERTTAFVHGHCVGAGVELPAFCTTVIAEPDATFRLPEVAMGLVPGAGGTASIPRRVGRQRAAHLALTGDAIDATRAAEWGLVDAIAASR
jgi:enoyl-CoA hydratase/carnithine racemase